MHLIITEKNISAQRIAGILSGKANVAAERTGGIANYSYGDTVVVGLRGHVVEIDFEPGYSNWRSEEHTPRSLIDARTIKVPTEKRIVALVQRLARKADRVTIATDFDTEGELIGKEAYELVREVNKTVPVDRARFSAITPEEINAAFSHPTEIDFALAAAGEARQVVDLMWGASLTRFLSLAAHRGGQNILSVGRVQSPTLAMIVDREKEIEAFRPEKYWQLTLLTRKAGEQVEARHTAGRFTSQGLAEEAQERSKPPLTVTEVREGRKKDHAPTPLDTTGFIVAAARLGFSAANAMRIAEDLYMNGYISYPRTDNTVYPKSLDIAGILRVLSDTAFSDAVAWVRANRRPVPTSGKKSSTDHPPIHPTGAGTRAELGEERWRIYELVSRRFLATLSPDAEWLTMKVNFDAGGEPYTATGARLISPGWRTVYPYSEAKERILPSFEPGEQLPIEKTTLEEKETLPPARFTQSRLIQRMEELGLGTKSTRHEVIQKLVSRKYVEGNPLRPTLVGRAVIESLEDHAATITKPVMTQTLESHMQQIKERKRERDDVVTESRTMLHRVFDELETHGGEIGGDIMERTAEELTLGPCPACGADIRIRHLRSQSQFIGCSAYPECGFNIGLPRVQWGFAIRTDDICPVHGLHHIRLVKKGARPWEIGCPLCHHITSNAETLDLMKSMRAEYHEKLRANHVYTVYELAKTPPAKVALILGVPEEEAFLVIHDAEDVLELLRKRSDCRKFVRKHLPPRRGRSHAAILKKLQATGVVEVADLARIDPAVLRSAGVGEHEAEVLRGEAAKLSGERALKAIGIPTVSLKKYLDAGVVGVEDLAAMNPAWLSAQTGLSPETVHRHVETAARALGTPIPEKVTKAQIEKGKRSLIAIQGLGEATVERLLKVGVVNADQLAGSDADTLAGKTGIPVAKILDYQKRAAATVTGGKRAR